MKANPKKLGGRKGDRMTPDWLDGYVVDGLTDHQVVLRNTKTNKVLKSMSLVHIKPLRVRGVGDKVVSSQVETVDNEVETVDDNVESSGDEGDGANQVACEQLKGVGDKVEGVGNKTGSVDAEVAGDKTVQVVDVDDKVESVDAEVAGDKTVQVVDVNDKVESVDDKVAGAYGEVVGVEVVNVDGVDNEVPRTASSNFTCEVDHLIQLSINGIPLFFPYLDFGPAKLTRRDMWSLIPPQEVPACQLHEIRNAVPDFVPGWLSDMVSDWIQVTRTLM